LKSIFVQDISTVKNKPHEKNSIQIRRLQHTHITLRSRLNIFVQHISSYENTTFALQIRRLQHRLDRRDLQDLGLQLLRADRGRRLVRQLQREDGHVERNDRRTFVAKGRSGRRRSDNHLRERTGK